MERVLGQVLWLVFGGPAAKNIIVDLLWLMQKMAACGCGIKREADVQIGNHVLIIELTFQVALLRLEVSVIFLRT
jgi:hypothetical protein